MLRDEPRPETHQQDADLDPEQKEIDRHAHDFGHLLDFTSHPPWTARSTDRSILLRVRREWVRGCYASS